METLMSIQVGNKLYPTRFCTISAVYTHIHAYTPLGTSLEYNLKFSFLHVGKKFCNRELHSLLHLHCF
jgi:hypothetical protein